MIKMDGFYLMEDLNQVGKIEHAVPYIYDDGWSIDNDNVLMDRIMGYYPGEGIGNTDMLDRVKSITEQEVQNFINNI